MPAAACPRPGSVLVIDRAANARGHVAVVRRVLGPREIRVDHANWASGQARGRIHHDQPVRDISLANDWSRVLVWYPPIGDFGRTAYPARGFIHPERLYAGSRVGVGVEGIDRPRQTAEGKAGQHRRGRPRRIHLEDALGRGHLVEAGAEMAARFHHHHPRGARIAAEMFEEAGSAHWIPRRGDHQHHPAQTQRRPLARSTATPA